MWRISVRRDRTLEADSLSVLGRTLADRKQWRGALDSLRLSLELRETAELRSQYEKLRAEHGFRLLDYSVDSDSISPRACFQFSEELPGRRTDFSPSSRWQVSTGRRSRQGKSNFAWKGSNTANAIP